MGLFKLSLPKSSTPQPEQSSGREAEERKTDWRGSPAIQLPTWWGLGSGYVRGVDNEGGRLGCSLGFGLDQLGKGWFCSFVHLICHVEPGRGVLDLGSDICRTIIWKLER